MTNQEKLLTRLYSISIFRKLQETEELSALIDYLSCKKEPAERLRLYSRFVASLSKHSFNFTDFLKKAVREDENFYIIAKAQKKALPEVAEDNLSSDLNTLTLLSGVTPELLLDKELRGLDCAPVFDSEKTDFSDFYGEILENLDRYGYGIFSSATMFRIVNGEIVPIDSCDNISLSDFVGYEREREKVINNTLNFLEGKDAANVLLCGDAGTGKSSTVKACVNHFAHRGLRLIELRKDQLFSLPDIMDKIAGNPLRFIIFIDDLSFNKNDDCFSMLKAAVEGSASAKAKNALIYATSNRRHIVKESFSDRNGDDIHRNDTVQELLSLSERFGLVVNFSKPNKILYLDIVHALAAKKGIRMSQEELDVKAEAFALAKSSRSPRAAEQFIKSLN